MNTQIRNKLICQKRIDKTPYEKQIAISNL